MTQEQQRIWEYLTQNCIGIRNVQNVSTIAHACGFNDHGTNNDNFRAIVTDMVVNGRKPIGSCKMDILLLQQSKKDKLLLTGLTGARKSKHYNKFNHIKYEKVFNGIWQERKGFELCLSNLSIVTP